MLSSRVEDVMKPLFFPDPNHESDEPIKNLLSALPGFAKEGYTTLFLEFLCISPNEKDLEEEFVDCAGGRRYMAKAYLSLFTRARELKMKVVGLTRDEYFRKDRMNQTRFFKHKFAFRFYGDFDAVAAEIIRQNATSSDDYVVFLGAGHWPHLSKRLDNLQLAEKCDEKPLDEKEFTEDLRKVTVPWRDRILFHLLSSAVKASKETTEIKVMTFGKEVALNASPECSIEAFALKWKEVTGCAPDAQRVEAILAVCKKLRE